MRRRIILLLLISFIGFMAFAQEPGGKLEAIMKQAGAIRDRQLSEANFRMTCDLAQSAALLNLDSGYSIIRKYLRLTGKDPHKRFILLMGWARAETALGGYENADSIYRVIRSEYDIRSREYRETCVASVLLWTEYDKTDSVDHYFPYWKTLAKEAADQESLSFLYCFRTMAFYLRNDRDSMKFYFDEAIRLAGSVENKNALFTAKYNYANLYWQNNPQQQIICFNELRELALDPSLAHYPPKLYERTAFSFRNARPSVSYQLAQLNLLMADYETAGKFAQEFYDLTIKDNPMSGQAPIVNAEMAIVKAYQNDWVSAGKYLGESRKGFERAQKQITYPGYFIAAALLAEHEKHYEEQLGFIQTAMRLGKGRGLYVMPVEMHYANALIRNRQFNLADELFRSLPVFIKEQPYSAPGLYYYQYLAELRKAQGKLADHVEAMNTYFQIKDSLISFNRYRAVQEVLAKMEMKSKEQQISFLDNQRKQLQRDLQKERIFYGLLSVLLLIIILLLIRMRRTKVKQQALAHQNEMIQLAREREIGEVKAVITAEQRQRSLIAAELHNEINSMLSLSILTISSELEKNGADQKRNERLQKVWDGLTQVSHSIRDLSHRLVSPTLAINDFKRSIQQMVEMLNVAGKIQTELIVVGLEDSRRYPPQLLSTVHTILQELFQNIIKHAGAAHALIEIVEHDDHLSIMVEDDGVGISLIKETTGFGIKVIYEKLAELNGTIEVLPGKERGTLIVIAVPLHLGKPAEANSVNE